MSDLADLTRQAAFYQAGGQDPGTRTVDKIADIFGTVKQGGDDMASIVKNVLAIKKQALENKALQGQQQSVGSLVGVPTTNQVVATSEAARNAPIPAQDLASGHLDTMQAGINQATNQAKQYQDYQDVKGVSPDATLDQAKEMATIRYLQSGVPLRESQTAKNNRPDLTLSVKALPLEAQKRALAAGFLDTDVLDLKTFNAIKGNDISAPVPFVSPKDALAAGEGPGNTKVIDPNSGKAKDEVPTDKAGLYTLANESIRNVGLADKVLFPTGTADSFRRDVAVKSKIPFIGAAPFSKEGQNVRRWLRSSLSARQLITTGVAARPDETEELVNNFMVGSTSNPNAAKKALEELKGFYEDYNTVLTTRKVVPLRMTPSLDELTSGIAIHNQNTNNPAPDDNEAMKWAKEHPLDPMAQEILKVQGK